MKDLKRDLAIDPTDLDTDITRQASLYAYYSEAATKANMDLKAHRLRLEIFEAALYQKFKDLAFARGERITEKSIDSLIRGHPEWQSQSSRLIELEAIVEQLSGIVRAMSQKKDMLVAFSANRRSDRSGHFGLKGDRHEEGNEIALLSLPS